MVSTETELKDDVRELTGYTSTKVLTTDGLDAAYRTAQRHIRIKKSLDSNYDWYGSEKVAAREALFWFTCLFSKVKTGELDSQGLQAGALDADVLLAKDNDSVTTWYRNARDSLQSIKSSNIIQSTSPSRTDRDYEPDSYDSESGGTDVDSIDL
jgi:hypothetical protein